MDMPQFGQSHAWLCSHHAWTSPSLLIPWNFNHNSVGMFLGNVSPRGWSHLSFGNFGENISWIGVCWEANPAAGQGWVEDTIPGSLLQPALPKFPPCAQSFPAFRVFIPSVWEGIIPQFPGSRLPDPIALLFPFSQSETYQEDIYPMTPGTEPALTPDEWLSGVNRGKPTTGISQKYLGCGKRPPHPADPSALPQIPSWCR